MRSLVTRNLSIHRPHNRLTAISISVSVSMVVFISSVVNAQLGSMDLRALQVAGSPITVALYGTPASDPSVVCLTGVLTNHSDLIAGSAWRSTALDMTLSTPGRVYSQRLSVYVDFPFFLGAMSRDAQVSLGTRCLKISTTHSIQSCFGSFSPRECKFLRFSTISTHALPRA